MPDYVSYADKTLSENTRCGICSWADPDKTLAYRFMRMMSHLEIHRPLDLSVREAELEPIVIVE